MGYGNAPVPQHKAPQYAVGDKVIDNLWENGETGVITKILPAIEGDGDDKHYAVEWQYSPTTIESAESLDEMKAGD